MVKFKIKNCLTSFKNLIKSLTCCNSSCCTQTVEVLSEDTINKIQQLQDQLEEVWGVVRVLKENSPVTTPEVSTSNLEDLKEPVSV